MLKHYSGNLWVCYLYNIKHKLPSRLLCEETHNVTVPGVQIAVQCIKYVDFSNRI